jgi:hypothetical protein
MNTGNVVLLFTFRQGNGGNPRSQLKRAFDLGNYLFPIAPRQIYIPDLLDLACGGHI